MRPAVSVLTVNFNGAHLLPELLQALRRQTFDRFEVLVVDNGSTDDSEAVVARRLPEARWIPSRENLGFAGGNNLGLEHARGEYLALINNDAVPEPTWLEALVREIRSSEEIAGVGSKLVFFKPFLPIRLEVETARPSVATGSPDDRELGALVDERSGFRGCDYRKPIFRDGFFGPERHGGRVVRWTRGAATLLLPVESADRDAVLDLVAAAGELAPGRRLGVRIGESFERWVELSSEPREHAVEVPAEIVRATAVDVINNAGTFINRHGEAGDLGINQPDRGQHDRAEDVAALCGASMLLRRDLLEDLGFFDRDFFMYYEDTDLSWRLRRRGYRLRYQPESVARHLHATSMVEWSPGFVFLTARNRVLTIVKNGTPRQLLRAWGLEVYWTLRRLGGWLRRLGRPAPEHRQELVTRLRVELSLLRLVPKMLLKRMGWLAH